MTSRIVVLPTSLPPIMALTPRDRFHLRGDAAEIARW
jgi:hypothetical protein